MSVNLSDYVGTAIAKSFNNSIMFLMKACKRHASAKKKRCVQNLMSQGKSEASAYAI